MLLEDSCAGEPFDPLGDVNDLIYRGGFWSAPVATLFDRFSDLDAVTLHWNDQDHVIRRA